MTERYDHDPGCRCPVCDDEQFLDWAVARLGEHLAGEIEQVHKFWASTEPIVIRRGDTVTLRTSAAELARRRFERERERDEW